MAVCVLAGVGHAGAHYFNGLNYLLANPNCKSDCCENGVRAK